MAGSSAPDERLRQAIEALLEPERFREAERRLARALPELQNVLARALAEGGWLEPSRMEAIDRVAATADPAERATAIRTMLAEEARLAMLVGVAVGWELARELEGQRGPAQSE
jgi:hypothetical protein